MTSAQSVLAEQILGDFVLAVVSFLDERFILRGVKLVQADGCQGSILVAGIIVGAHRTGGKFDVGGALDRV